MAMSEDLLEEHGDVSPSEEIPQADDPIPPSDPLEVEPLISLNAFVDLFAP
jgi:hypothetical protein